MKKYLIILGLFLCFGLNAQWIGIVASSGGERTYLDVLTTATTPGWYIAHADNITIVDDSVSQWSDVSGNANHLVQGTSANRPIFADDSVYFDGTDLLAIDVTNESEPVGFYIVVKKYHAGAFFPFFELGSNTILRTAGNSANINMLGSSSSHYIACANETWVIITGVWDGANSMIQINDGTPVTGDIGGGSLLDFINLGQSASGERFAVKEFIPRIVNDPAGDKTLVRNYLNTKYTIF